MKAWKIALGTGLLAAGAWVGVAWSTPWNAAWEAIPAGTALASDLDTFINLLKAEIRQRAEVEHIWGGSGTANDNGLHAMGSGRCFLQAAAPTDINGGTAALGPYDSTAGADASTLLTTDEPGTTTRDIGAGRCWIDLDGPDGIAGNLDDNKLMTWDETANAWVAAKAEAASSLGSNLIYNGSFEITDGTGDSTATCSACVSGTGVPSGWAALTTPDLAYDSINDTTEGDGIALETINDTGNNEGVTQTLAGLKESTQYVFRARVRPVVGTCDLQITGGAATVTDTSSDGTGVFETLEVVATTTAGPADLVVRLESNLVAGPDECDWDHVTAFEQSAVVSQPGAQACRVTEGTVSANYYGDGGWTTVGTTCAVTVPGPGYMIDVRGRVLADEDNGAADGGFVVRLQENINGGGAATVGLAAENVRIGGVMSVEVSFLRSTSVTPGSTYVYTMDGQTDVGGGLDRNWDDAEAQGETPLSVLEVRLVPTR